MHSKSVVFTKFLLSVYYLSCRAANFRKLLYIISASGVPFGEVSVVNNWLKINGVVGKPKVEHPKRQIEGLNCKRREVSGERFWNFIKSVSGTPEIFFKNCLVYNHCPLIFMGKSGKNVTPPDMKIDVRNKLLQLCDETLKDVIELYSVKHIVGLGRFAETRAKKVVNDNLIKNVDVSFLIHPSPASPAANKGWNDLAYKTLTDSKVIELMK